MSATLRQLTKLVRFLEAEKAKPKGLEMLASQMDRDVALSLNPKDETVDAKTMGRILGDAKILGEIDDGHGQKYSAEQLLGSKRTKLPVLYRYLEQRNFQSTVDPADFFGRVTDFFRTTDDQYGLDHLIKLEGTYKMYRRCWFNDPVRNFMQSWVTIYANREQNIYKFNERQIFPDFQIKESSDGFLFPSGRSVLALCRSVRRDTVKFISINDLYPDNAKYFEPIKWFSGNGIATTDAPPHTGYGFHCQRFVEKKHPRKGKSSYEGKIYRFEQLKEEKFDIFRKIVEYERFQNVDFIPTEGVT